MTQLDGRPPAARTRWRRVGLVLVPAYSTVAAVLYLAWSGAVAVSFAVSGTAFTVTAASLTSGQTDGNGVGFYQFGVGDFAGSGAPLPQIESVIPDARLTGLCQSVSIAPLTLRITAGDAGTPVTATNLVVGATSLTAESATFTDLQIGQDLGQLSHPALTEPVARGSGPNVQTANLPPGTFGQTAKSVTITGVRQVSNGTSASSFTLPHLSVAFGASC
ncbi:MAG TPA: DUF6230 family protein [Candidatus Dormibacteraeota bacterium]|nr:DUF6230 family protein [Candidatus Dormibacteraeota bacterium]